MLSKERRRHANWKWLLGIPFVGLLLPALYARAEPSLFGFPFFYWYQFAWVPLSVAVTALVWKLER